MDDILNSNDIVLKFSRAEELAETELTKALIGMLDIYEVAIHTCEHHVVDAIELWICHEGNEEIICELEKRINGSIDKKLISTYKIWRETIESKVIDKDLNSKRLPVFHIGDEVEVVVSAKNTTYHKGIIYDMKWHFKENKWFYYIFEGKRKISKRYDDTDLVLIKCGKRQNLRVDG